MTLMLNLFEEKIKKKKFSNGWRMSSIKSQILNVGGIVGLMVSVTSTQLCPRGVKAAQTMHKQTSVVVFQ